MYIRLNKNRTKKYYQTIVNLAIKETEAILEKNSKITLYNSIYNQLLDIQEQIINNNAILSEDELYDRYSLGAIAVKNFSLENDEYAQKLSDSFGGAFDYSSMPER
ncbi:MULTISPECIES: immunity protein Tsi6 family protein [Francisella]|uniref:immunity protein Tsi6 family protein n=1 Tax=Francisella TaxID=262 RepID=UPI00123D6B36|nr:MULTISPECIES: immunity protein Tsi6 family protein [Francisella]MBK2266493.1 hypothetical protein [Francisella philomiragia]MBK2278339.1 hypothetical protein [Francisella philomiragia]MBK2286195.1 hypothetical protein [Francisella philomiragia]MBK2287776.1 hypothetical protein [Francisella philomiragia]MBK2290154.1 hypothetical protein [Francisella philomiragia]